MAFKRSPNAFRRTVREGEGGFSALLARVSDASSKSLDEMDDALSEVQENVLRWYRSWTQRRQTSAAKGFDRLRTLQERRARSKATSAPAPLISVFESYEYDSVRSRFRTAAEAAHPVSWRDQDQIAQLLMALAVPLVIGVLVGAVGVFSADIAESLVELRWSWTEELLNAEGPKPGRRAADTGAASAPPALGLFGADLSVLTTPAYPWFVGFSMVCAAVAALLTTFCPAASGSGIPQVKAELNGVRVPGALASTTLAVKIIGVTLTVASGLPAGREGPMVQLGAGVAALVLHAHNKVLALASCRTPYTEGRLLDEDLDTRNFVSMGAAAGVAAAFDAPIGGVLFAIEEVSSHWPDKLTYMAFGGALVAAITTKTLKTDWGEGVVEDEGLFIVGRSQEARFGVHEAPLFLLIGVLGGLLGAAFNYLNGRVNNFRRWLFTQDAWVCRALGVRSLKVIEAAFLAWLVATCFFVLPLFYPCTSIAEALGGGADGGGASNLTAAGAGSAPDPFGFMDDANGSTASAFRAAALAAEIDADDMAAAADLAEGFLVDMRCAEPHSYNQIASITLSSQHHVIKALLTRHAVGELFSAHALLLSLLLLFTLTAIVYGVTIPSGLFVPCLTMGALLGRCVGELTAQHLAGYEAVDAGFYALVGAGAMLAGVTRMTMSLTVILAEISNDAGSILPLMVAVFASRFTGDLFNLSLFDAAMSFAGYPYIEAETDRAFSRLTAEDVMTAPVVSLSEVETAQRIADVLKTTSHHAFPVVDTGENATHKHLIGMINRYQLEVLLRKRAFLPVDGEEHGEAALVLARAAFTIIDEDGDGTLTLEEMVSAFRQDERVRRLLTPLLTASSGGGVEEQVVAFKRLFMTIDKDGSGGIEVEEWEKFFEADLHGEEEAEEGGRVGDDQKVAQRRVLLARAAFTLMDEDSDGDLTLQEMVSAFRRDERVRRMLTPLLNIEASKSTIYSAGEVFLQQMEAFETLFKQIDKDGSGGIALDEFENFFTDPSAHRPRTGLAWAALSRQASAAAMNTSMASLGSASNMAAVRQSAAELDLISMSDFVAARNDARDKPPQKRLTASDAPLLMGNSDGDRKVDLRQMMDLAPHSVMHTMPLARLHKHFRMLGLRHIFVTDTRNEVMGVVTRKDLLHEVIAANVRQSKGGARRRSKGSRRSSIAVLEKQHTASKLMVHAEALV